MGEENLSKPKKNPYSYGTMAYTLWKEIQEGTFSKETLPRFIDDLKPSQYRALEKLFP